MKHLDQVRLMLAPDAKAMAVAYANREGLSLSMAVERLIRENANTNTAGAAHHGHTNEDKA